MESVEARKAVADNLSGSKATSGTSGGDSSESYNSGGNSGSRQQHHRHYRHHRSGKAKESSNAAKQAVATAAASAAPEVERKSLVARRISLDDLSSAFQALVSKKSGSNNSSNKSRSSSSASASAKKQHIVKKSQSPRAADNHSDNSGVDERSSGKNGDRYRSRSEESLLDTDEKLPYGGMIGSAEGGVGGVQNMVRSSASPGSASSPRPPSRTSASRIPLPLRSSASPFNFAAALRGEKEDSVDRYSASSSISDAAGMPMPPQPPPYSVATGGGTANSADYNPSAHMRPESTTSYLISRYGTAAAAAGGDAASGRYGSYTIYHNPSSHLPHGPQTSDYSAAAVVGNPGTRASYAGTASGAAKAEYFRGSYPTHYGTSTTVGEDGTMVVGQVDSQISPRWRRRSYDYENMPGSGPPQAQAAMATVRTTGSGRPLSELASGMARSRSRSRAPTEYTDHGGGGHGQQHPPPPPPAPPPTSSAIYHHHRYGGHPMGYRPASNYMYGHTYAGYHIPMGHSSAAAPTSAAAVSAANAVAAASTGMGIPGAAGQPMEPHPPPAYSRSDREISARLRRYHQQQPTSHN